MTTKKNLLVHYYYYQYLYRATLGNKPTPQVTAGDSSWPEGPADHKPAIFIASKYVTRSINRLLQIDLKTFNLKLVVTASSLL